MEWLLVALSVQGGFWQPAAETYPTLSMQTGVACETMRAWRNEVYRAELTTFECVQVGDEPLLAGEKWVAYLYIDPPYLPRDDGGNGRL